MEHNPAFCMIHPREWRYVFCGELKLLGTKFEVKQDWPFSFSFAVGTDGLEDEPSSPGTVNEELDAKSEVDRSHGSSNLRCGHVHVCKC